MPPCCANSRGRGTERNLPCTRKISPGRDRHALIPQVVPLFLWTTTSRRSGTNASPRFTASSATSRIPTGFDPLATASAGEVYRRLLEDLDAEEIQAPDEEMRKLLGREFNRYRKDVEADEVIAEGGGRSPSRLLSVLNSAVEEERDDDPDEELRSPGPAWRTGVEDDCERELLTLLLSEAPDRLSSSDIATALAGDPQDAQEPTLCEMRSRS